MREIVVHEALPGLKVGVLHRDIEIAAADIVDQDIDRPGFLQHLCAKRLANLGDRDIRRIGPGLASAFAHFGGGFGQGFRIARIKHHIGTGLGRRQGDDTPKSTAATGDKQAFAVQPKAVEYSHASYPSHRRREIAG